LARQGLRQEDIAAELGCLNQSVVCDLLKLAKAQGWSTTPEDSNGQHGHPDHGHSDHSYDCDVDDEILELSSPAILVANAARWADELPQAAEWVWNVVSDEVRHTDRWYAGDLQEVLGDAVARALVTVVRTGWKVGLDVTGTLEAGEPVWAEDRRSQVARERAAFAMWLEQREDRHAVPAGWLAARCALSVEEVRAAIPAARRLAAARWAPVEGVQPRLPSPDGAGNRKGDRAGVRR
jgi:hypothetical protein